MASDLPIKADVKVGERSTEKLIDAVIDAFSPATETLGFLGDAVRLARVEVAAAVTRRAKAIADERGLKLTAPPLKFLVPFYEKASLEDLENSTLMEMWANLLASAGSDYNARQLQYSSLLASMSSSQATILNGIAHNYGGTMGIDSEIFAICYDLSESRFSGFLRRISEENLEDVIDKILEEICIPGVSVVIVCAGANNHDNYVDWTKDDVFLDHKQIDFDILRSNGILEMVSTDFVTSKHAASSVTLYHVTELGFDFWCTCCGVTIPGD